MLRLTADEFVARTFAGPRPYPTYYAHMAAINTAGPVPVDISPVARVTADRLRDRIQAGERVVDLRHRTTYAVGHLAGTVSLGLDGPMATWLGWLKDWLAPVTLLAETPERIVTSLLANAGRQVVLIDDTFDRARLVGLPLVDGR